jgi:hypothetical protein
MNLVCLFGFEVRSERDPIIWRTSNPAHWWILAFAFACLLGSAYGFLQGAWPFGVIEIIWAAVAARRWWARHPD